MFGCPCCACLTLGERGGFEICPVCFWEDDGQDAVDADEVRGGPNGRLSLAVARYNYRRFGACDERFVGRTRTPLASELPPGNGEAARSEPLTRIEDDVRSTTGRELELLPDSLPGWVEVFVFLDGKPLGTVGQSFSEEPEEFIVEVIDRITEVFLHEAIWGGWPICPDHKTHPLEPRIDHERSAAWFCPHGRRVARVGVLSFSE